MSDLTALTEGGPRAGMTEDEFDPLPQDGTLALLYMIFRKTEKLDVLGRHGFDGPRFTVGWNINGIPNVSEGDDLKALLNQVWEEVNA